jgi:hypothetical protein
MKMFWVLVTSILIFGCCVFSPSSSADHEVQFIQIFYHSGPLDELDTFHGTYQKDLIPGTVKTTMWLTTREQEIILTNVEQIGFFSFPDTVDRPPNTFVQPDFGPQVIRINYEGRDKTVVWYDPIDSRSKVKYYMESLQILLNAIIFSKPEYKALPPRKGAYI